MLNSLLTHALCAEAWVLPYVDFPFGLSLLGVARKPAAGEAAMRPGQRNSSAALPDTEARLPAKLRQGPRPAGSVTER